MVLLCVYYNIDCVLLTDFNVTPLIVYYTTLVIMLIYLTMVYNINVRE